jgi:hypothetical protein
MSKYLEGARQRLEGATLNYARMKASGHYLDVQGGKKVMVRVCLSEVKDYLDLFAKNTLNAASELLDEMMAADLPPRAKSPK